MILISEVNGIVKCFYNEEDGTTQHDWTTFLLMPGERTKTRIALEAFLDFVKENKVQKHIVNVKHCTNGLLQEDIDWIKNYLVPKEVEYGIRYLANIVSEDIFTQMASEEWQEKVEPGLMVKNFITLEQARFWLANRN